MERGGSSSGGRERAYRDHDLEQEVLARVVFAAEAFCKYLHAMEEGGSNLERIQVVLDLCVDRLERGEIEFASAHCEASLEPLLAYQEERQRRLEFRETVLFLSGGRELKGFTAEQKAWIAEMRLQESVRESVETRIRERMGWEIASMRARSR